MSMGTAALLGTLEAMKPKELICSFYFQGQLQSIILDKVDVRYLTGALRQQMEGKP